MDCIIKELKYKEQFFKDRELKTIYFGGGTPSLLTINELELFHKAFIDFNQVEEFTFEINPDDVTIEYVRQLKQFGVTRLSLGIQSFNDQILKKLNRAHDSKQALKSLEIIANEGFDLNVDLIYGIEEGILESDLETLKSFNSLVSHISSYCLTIESKTALAYQLANGKFKECDESIQKDNFFKLHNELCKLGFEHYEISNFAKQKKYAIHNSGYWDGLPYLGIGPGAHSYIEKIRYLNIENNNKYIQRMNEGHKWYEVEALSNEDLINEYILISLRTKKGIDIDFLQSNYEYTLTNKKKEFISQLIKEKYLEENNNKYVLTLTGWFLSDEIISRLFT